MNKPLDCDSGQGLLKQAYVGKPVAQDGGKAKMLALKKKKDALKVK